MQGIDDPTHERPSELAVPAGAGTQILAVLLAVGPAYLVALFNHLTRNAAYTLTELLAYPSIFGTGTIVLILALNRYMCGEGLGAFNPRKGSIPRDVGAGVLLGGAALAVHFGLQGSVYRLLPGVEQNMDSVRVLFRGLSENPLVLAYFLGPVIWIGVAGFEELTRAFFLTRTWTVWGSMRARWALVALSALLFGLVHIYQGISGAVGNAVIGLLMGAFFLQFGRILPLIVAHALFDSAQIILVVSMVKRGVIQF